MTPLGTGSLTKLAKLWLDHNRITNLNPLGNMGYYVHTDPLLPSLSYFDASGQQITMPDLRIDLSQPVILGPATWKYDYGNYTTEFVTPSSGTTPNTLVGGTARGGIAPAPSPLIPGTIWKNQDGNPYRYEQIMWPMDTVMGQDLAIPAGAGTMNWPRREAGTYTFGFRSQGTGAGITPAGGWGSMIFSGTITQNVYKYKVTYAPGNGQAS
ncbi:hypothetical protein CRD60_04120 [Bifidobacterium aemilianum]|uniref:Uncharacterized protein n=1 Tax=Bifidobacterium aemilianum TaxID=2493120 RepID=A0A366K7Z4_9BIFI|nr:hypothetical protein [Bifidobacterium aemilianum]RBP97789.1 hypothetical protein CRD60_04120 [Bifidobacterium aemilianum]